MKYFVIFLILIATVMVTVNPISAQCAYDPSQPHKPCDDTHEFLLLDPPQKYIENINGMWYYVSEPLMSNSSVEKIIFHDVSFTLPYRNDPPRYTYSDVEFSDGTKETLSVLFDEPAFTEHVSPQAGFVGKTNGYNFLVSADLKELSPLKQFKAGISIEQIHCKESFVMITKYDDSPICVKYDTRTKLIERGWAKNLLYELDDNTIMNNVKNLKEVTSFLAKYPDASYGVKRDSWLVYYSVDGIIREAPEHSNSRTKEIQITIDSFGRPFGVGIQCGGPVTLSAQSNVIELLNTPNWCFPDGNEMKPEHENETIPTIKISKGEIVSAKAIKFNGWTNQPDQEIVLIITAPNGNVISTGNLSPMNNGTFVDAITTGGPLWEQQDGIYLVTVQQGNDPTNSAYFELDLKDGNIILRK